MHRHGSNTAWTLGQREFDRKRNGSSGAGRPLRLRGPGPRPSLGRGRQLDEHVPFSEVAEYLRQHEAPRQELRRHGVEVPPEELPDLRHVVHEVLDAGVQLLVYRAALAPAAALVEVLDQVRLA